MGRNIRSGAKQGSVLGEIHEIGGPRGAFHIPEGMHHEGHRHKEENGRADPDERLISGQKRKSGDEEQQPRAGHGDIRQGHAGALA